jgi:uncharacterized membrane protein
MSAAGRSIFVFGIYKIVLSVILIASPNTLLTLLRVPVTTEPWLSVLGVVVFVLGVYYLAAARAEMTAFFRVTVWGGWIVLVGFPLLVVFGSAPTILIAFALLDGVGAFWTRAALRTAA